MLGCSLPAVLCIAARLEVRIGEPSCDCSSCCEIDPADRIGGDLFGEFDLLIARGPELVLGAGGPGTFLGLPAGFVVNVVSSNVRHL